LCSSQHLDLPVKGLLSLLKNFIEILLSISIELKELSEALSFHLNLALFGCENGSDQAALNMSLVISTRVLTFDISYGHVLDVAQLDTSIIINFDFRQISPKVSYWVNFDRMHVLEHVSIAIYFIR
jgi:hypothetical protein